MMYLASSSARNVVQATLSVGYNRRDSCFAAALALHRGDVHKSRNQEITPIWSPVSHHRSRADRPPSNGLALRSRPAPRAPLLLQVGDDGLPVFEPAEPDHLVDPEVLQEHPQDDEPFTFAGEDASNELDLLGSLVDPLVELLMRSAATFTANVPDGRLDRHGSSWIVPTPASRPHSRTAAPFDPSHRLVPHRDLKAPRTAADSGPPPRCL